jgi:sigma-B regulation protein RsbU (phosphoserine phosphatase)
MLKTRGAPIGMMADTKYVSAYCQITPPSRLFVFSDGGYEVRQANGQFWNLQQFIQLLKQQAGLPGSLQQIVPQIQALTGAELFADDFSLLQITVNG